MEMLTLLCVLGMCITFDPEDVVQKPTVYSVETVAIVPPCVEPRRPLAACQPKETN
jgi:hypothetical protein